MIDCLRTRVRKQPIIALFCYIETVHKFYNHEAWSYFSLPAEFCPLLLPFANNLSPGQARQNAWPDPDSS